MLICTYKYLEAFKEAANEDNALQRSVSGVSQTAADVGDGGMNTPTGGEYGSSCVSTILHVHVYR